MLPLDPQELQTLEAFSFWGHYQKEGKRYVALTRFALKAIANALKRRGAKMSVQSMSDDELVDIIETDVLAADRRFSAYLQSKSHLPHRAWPAVRNSFARMIVASARSEILVGL